MNENADYLLKNKRLSQAFLAAQNELAVEIKRVRKSCDHTQSSLSDDMACEEKWIAYLEGKDSNPTLLTLIKVQIATGKKLTIRFED